MKLLEDEDNLSISHPALPNIDNNIQFGNSLIESNQTTQENQEAINPFDFGEIKFGCYCWESAIFGNRTYQKVYSCRITNLQRNFWFCLQTIWQILCSYWKSFGLLKPNGILGFIIPSKFAKVGAGKKIKGASFG